MERTPLSTLTDVRNHLENNRQSAVQSLAYAGLSDDGVAEVAKFVRDNPFVKYLDMRGNNIEAKGAHSLANGMKLNRSLRTLNLKWNRIGVDPDGVSALCTMLKSNLTIAVVDLQKNLINHLGATHLAEVLISNKTITHLDLSWNDFGPAGGVTLLEALKRNQSLIEFQLAGSKVGGEVLHEVESLLRRNRATAKVNAELQPQAEERPPTADGAPAGAGYPTGDDAQRAPRQRSEKEDRSLMLRLLMRERECVQPEEKLFYVQVYEHIDKLLKERSSQKKGQNDAEEREKSSTTGFLDREQRYNAEIQTSEQNLMDAIADKATLEADVAKQAVDLKSFNVENVAAIRENMKLKELAMSEEQQLRKECRDILREKNELKGKLALGAKDLELLNQENERLQEFVATFQRNSDEILFS